MTDPCTVTERPETGKPDSPLERWKAALAMPGLSYREKVLVLALAWHDGKGGIFASLDTLATESDMKRWAVAEALNALEAKGAIVRTRAQRSNRYVVVYDFHSRENPDGGNGNPTVRKNQIPPSGKPGSHRQENPDANGNNGFNPDFSNPSWRCVKWS